MAKIEPTHPGILWAQRADTVLMTVNVNDIKDEKFSLDEKKFIFSGVGEVDQQQFACELEFLEEVVPQESKHKKTARGLFFVIKKKKAGPYWSRLTSGKKKVPYIHTDFNRWKDEDESESEGENPSNDNSLQALMQQMGGMGGGGMGGMPGMGGMSGMPGMGGMPGMAGMMGGGKSPANLDDLEESDSDDEPLPGLES